MGKIARGLFWRFSKSPERKWGWFEKRQNGSEGLLSQNCPIKLCYSWLIACKHLIKVFFWSRADLKLVGNLGLIGPAVTGILHCNVINHAIKYIIEISDFANYKAHKKIFNKMLFCKTIIITRVWCVLPLKKSVFNNKHNVSLEHTQCL